MSTIPLKGNIDEDFHAPDISALPPGKVELNLKEVTGINSTGIRLWTTWTKALTQHQLVLAEAPPVFVNQLNMIVGFIPKNSIIKSFYVPYFCEDTDDEMKELFRAGDHFVGPDIKIEVENINRDGKTWTVDVVADKYFRFLKSYPEIG